MLKGNLRIGNRRYRPWIRGQRDGASEIANTAASSSTRKAAAALALCSAYHDHALFASSSALGWKRTGKSATCGAPETLPHYLPWNALDSAGLKIPGAPLNLHAPSFLDAFFDLRIETFDERCDQVGTILLA